MKLTILAVLLAICILSMYTGPVESRGGRGGGGRGGSGRGGSGRGGSGRGGSRTGNTGSGASISGDGFGSGNGTLSTIGASFIGGGVGVILLAGGVVLAGCYIKQQMKRGRCSMRSARKQKTEVNIQDVKGNYGYNSKIEEGCPPPYEQYKQ